MPQRHRQRGNMRNSIDDALEELDLVTPREGDATDEQGGPETSHPENKSDSAGQTKRKNKNSTANMETGGGSKSGQGQGEDEDADDNEREKAAAPDLPSQLEQLQKAGGISPGNSMDFDHQLAKLGLAGALSGNSADFDHKLAQLSHNSRGADKTSGGSLDFDEALAQLGLDASGEDNDFDKQLEALEQEEQNRIAVATK